MHGSPPSTSATMKVSGSLWCLALIPRDQLVQKPINLEHRRRRGTMVDVNAKGKSRGCSVGTCIGYFVYFSILVAVAVIGKFRSRHIS